MGPAYSQTRVTTLGAECVWGEIFITTNSTVLVCELALPGNAPPGGELALPGNAPP